MSKNKKENVQEEKSLEVVKSKSKQKLLINTSSTILLVAIIIASFIAITLIVQKINPTPIDLTADKIFTLTEESKEQVKNINKEIKIYYIGKINEDPSFDLARQYEKVNEKIKVEAVTVDERPDIAQKYEITRDSQGIIVESGEKYKILTSNDLYTYDYQTYESISVAEEKLTAAIKSVTSDKVPKVYFLEGYSSLSLMNGGMQYLGVYLQNEVNEVQPLDILSKGKVPEDCDTLVVISPEKDFDEIATNGIIEYIKNGGNILWLNPAMVQKVDFPNVEKVLAEYGVKPFEVGIVRETDTSKMIEGAPNLIMPVIQYSDVTTKLNNAAVIFVSATKINIDDEKLEELKVTKTDLIKTSSNAYFRTNFSIDSFDVAEGETKEEILIGAKLEKKINDDKTSKLVIYGDSYFVSDLPLTQGTQMPIIAYAKNKDLMLNSIAYLSNREEDITVRKSTGTVTYKATEQENTIILIIIFGVPSLIIIAGIVVTIIRRRKK